MAIEWREDLATGVNEIDDQHKELFRRFDALLKACNEGLGKDELLRLLLFLDEYIITHFTAEEKIMRECGYLEYMEHKQQHRQFVRQLEKLKQQIGEEGTGLTLVLATNQMMIDWLINHISKMDKEISGYMQK